MLGLSLSTGRGLSGPIYRVDQVPESFHEHYIISGYRHPRSSVTQCLLSLFDATNETLNFWTHFIPTWYFVWVLYQLSDSFDFFGDPYSWPLLCFLICCCTFPMASATAHLFNVMSYEARQFCFFLDYAALSLFSCGTAIAYRAYSFPKEMLEGDGLHGWFRDNFINIAIVNAIFCTMCTCATRFFKPSPMRKVMRLGGFVFPYCFDFLPLVYRLLLSKGEESHLSGDYYLVRHFFFSFLAVFLYGSHLPERLLPGSFDIVGHSHQLFHVAAILAVLDQLQGVLLDVKERQKYVETQWDFAPAGNSLGIMIFVLLANVFIITLYTLHLYRKQHHKKTA